MRFPCRVRRLEAVNDLDKCGEMIMCQNFNGSDMVCVVNILLNMSTEHACFFLQIHHLAGLL